jgi:hypothetical protein
MTVREFERRRRQSDRDRDDRARQEQERARQRENFIKRFEANDNRVLTFLQWCTLNGFSAATGRRIIKSGKGPVITQLSERRIGITVGNNRKWQASLARPVVSA